MNLEECLPAALRGPTTTLARMASSFSGAGVYRVDAAGRAFVLKIAREDQPFDDWRRNVDALRLAAKASLAPEVVHVDEARRAVLSAHVVDRSFPALYLNPATHEAAIALLGRTVRAVHDLPAPTGVAPKDPRQTLSETWSRLASGPALPSFVGEAALRVLAEPEPARERPPVLSHNDVHPANLVYDGEKLLLVDWDTAGPNDPLYDLATISVFLRMDGATCQRLLAAYEGGPVGALPARFVYSQRLVAVLCGATFLTMALRNGHAGDPAETIESAPTLVQFYQRLRAGTVNPATGEGQWSFGLALVKEGAAR